jgi:acetolactate synthase I/II/III large subunit
VNVAELIVRYLEDLDVNTVFYIPGGPLVGLSAALWKSEKIRLICCGHEGGASLMACGYAMSSDRLAVCCFTTGPGATNGTTGVATAKLEGIPMLVLTAMNPLEQMSRRTLQDSSPHEGIDTVAMYRPLTLYSHMIHHPAETHHAMRTAIKTALFGRGPVHVSVPADVAFQDAPTGVRTPRPDQYLPKLVHAPDPCELEKAATLIRSAKRPLLFLGYGAVQSNASDAIRSLAEDGILPVITTIKAKGVFPEQHPLSLGVLFGFGSSERALAYLREGVDVLVSIGVGYHELDTQSWTTALVPSKALVQVDIDPQRYGFDYPADVGLIGDAREVVTRLLDEIRRRGSTTADEPGTRVVRMNGAALGRDEAERSSNAVPLKPQRLMRELQDAFPADTVYVADSGLAFIWAAHQFVFNEPKRFIVSTRCAPMGFGMSAIGCKLARPGHPVVALVGDGAMRMNGMEIATAVNYGLSIFFVVLNDAQWGLVRFGHRALKIDAEVARYRRLDFVHLAECVGAKGIRITRPGEIHQEVNKLLREPGPVVFDVHVDPDECPPLGSRIERLSALATE